jgi:hypothetical protein
MPLKRICLTENVWFPASDCETMWAWILQKTASGRKHWSAGQRQQLLTRFHQSQLSQQVLP